MTVENIKEVGRMENNMGRENFSIPKMEYGKKEYGVKEEELNGKMPISNNNYLI
jgi:hypothetical protein